MSKKRRGEKTRVEFRQNRGARARAGDWTREFNRAAEQVTDATFSESVRPKGELSRKRTIIVKSAEELSADAAVQQQGTVTAICGTVSRVTDDAGVVWECSARRVLRTRQIDQRSAVTVGDRVCFTGVESADSGARSGVIERVEPRRTLLSRKVRAGHDARRDRLGRQHLLVANADQLLIVASVAQPALKPHLIDRYLVAAQKGGLRPILCFNKVDLLAKSNAAIASDGDLTSPQQFDETMAEFVKIGVFCLALSARGAQGVGTLRDVLAGHITVVSGQSGVGKSSLLNAIQPGLHLAVGEVSQENEKGRHTTSHAELFRLSNGGFVVDTPGVRQFDIWNVSPGELEAYFVEFVPHVAQCRYRNCTHRDEEGCAVIAAVADGRISRRRHESYVKMFEEC